MDTEIIFGIDVWDAWDKAKNLDTKGREIPYIHKKLQTKGNNRYC